MLTYRISRVATRDAAGTSRSCLVAAATGRRRSGNHARPMQRHGVPPDRADGISTKLPLHIMLPCGVVSSCGRKVSAAGGCAASGPLKRNGVAAGTGCKSRSARTHPHGRRQPSWRGRSAGENSAPAQSQTGGDAATERRAGSSRGSAATGQEGWQPEETGWQAQAAAGEQRPPLVAPTCCAFCCSPHPALALSDNTLPYA